MKLSDILRIFRKNLLILVFFPLLLAALVFFKTRDEEKEYSSNFLVYTGIASGYNLTTEEHPRIDHNAVSNAFDNLLTTLKARETIEEVGIRLMVTHLRLEAPDNRIVSLKNYNHIRQMMPDSMEERIRNAPTPEDAVAIVYSYKYSQGNNVVKALLNSPTEVYGVSHITEKLSAKRKDLSDMLEVSYTANDPAICQHTLQVLSEVFIRRYKELKRGEINNVVAYFDRQMRTAQDRLKQAEEKLKDFEVKNQIINYDEQTRAISEAKQTLIGDIEKEKLLLSAAQSRARNLQGKLNMRKGMLETNDKVLEKRKQLAELNYKLANEHLFKDRPLELAKIKEEAEAIKDEIREIVADLYKLSASEEGLPVNELMTQWLNNILIIDESTARLTILEERVKEYDQMYDKYAPLGSTLNRMKREIEVNEKEYMDQLNAYNMNRQRQQNIEMASTIRIVDKPFYPLEPKPSKRSMLVAGSFVAGFILIFGIFLSFAFFDNRINAPARAETVTGLRVCGALPLVRKKESRFDVEYLESSLMEQAISAIVLEIKQRGAKPGTKYIMLSSTRSGEGKSWCGYKLASKLSEIRGKVLYLCPETEEGRASFKEQRIEGGRLDILEYAVARDFVSKESLGHLMQKKSVDFESYSYVLLEIPSLSENQLPVELVRKMDMSLLIVRADRAWTETDNYVTKLYRKACNCDPMVLLNRVSPDGLKEIFGKIPKKGKHKIPSMRRSVSADGNNREEVAV